MISRARCLRGTRVFDDPFEKPHELTMASNESSLIEASTPLRLRAQAQQTPPSSLLSLRDYPRPTKLI